MALEGNLTELITPEMLSNFSQFVNVLEALGIAIIAYIAFNIVNAILNRKKRDEMRKINKNLEEIKVLLGKKKKRKK